MTTELDLSGAKVSGTGLELPADMSFDDWAEYGGRLSRMAEGVMWWIGDWWRYGEARYGERAAQVLDADGYSFQTYADAGWVARKMETSRRREVLSWSHHREVAALDADVADRLLDDATAYGWTRNELRAQVKKLKREKATAEVVDRATPLDGGNPIQVRQETWQQTVERLGDGSVSLLLTDPPYAVTENDWDTFADDEDFWAFTAEWLAALRPKMADEFTAFVFCDADASPRMCRTMHDTGWPVLRQVIWHRPNLAKKRAGSLTFLSAYEPFWHAGTRGLMLPDEWGDERFDVQRFVVPQSNHVEDTSYHPTQKPIGLFRRLVQVGSAPGELVVDPFCGSGTTPVAAQFEDRRCVAGDQSAAYVQIALGRLAGTHE